MDFLSKLFRKSPRSAKREKGAPGIPLLTEWPSGLAPLSSEGVCAAPMAIATVYRCVRVLSDMVSVMPFRLEKRKGPRWEEDDRWRLPYLLTIQPNEAQNAYDFWTGLVSQVLIRGNAYVVPFRSDYSDSYDRFILLNPGTCYWSQTGRVYVVNDMDNGITREFREDEILHFRGFSPSGREGVGVITFARQTLATAEAGNTETHERFSSGGHVRGFLSEDMGGVAGYGAAQTEQLNLAAHEIDFKFRAGDRIVRLPNRATFKELTLSSADMQFLETRKFTVREICRFFGVHPSFVFDDTSNNYKSAEMSNTAFLSQTLNPLLNQIEVEFRRKLFTEREAMRYRTRFDRRAINACDMDTQVKWQAARIAAGLDTVNEAREADGRPPVADGDKVLVSANLKPLSGLMAEGGQMAAPGVDNDTDKQDDDDNDKS